MATINGNDFSFNRSSELNLAELDGSNGFVINSIDESDRLGSSVSTAGDINGDGFDDLIVGAPNADPNGQYDAGQSYVVFGSGEGFNASFDLALDGSNGFVINSIEGGRLGRSVSTAGDINGDGFDDLIVGAPFANSNGQVGAGESYVVFGKQEGFAASFNRAELDGNNGFTIQGIDEGDFSGTSVSTAGDVNGDGFDDLIVGASLADVNGQYSAGESYVVFGSGEGFAASFSLAELNGSNGFTIQGIEAYDNLGISASTAGDVNGDSFDDLIVSAPFADPNGQFSAGESYVVFGKQEGFAASLGLAELDGSNGFVINGTNERDEVGISVSTAGDINGDGLNDLLIGAPFVGFNGQSAAGESYVVFGKQEGFTASLDLAELNGSNGFVINGTNERDFSGSSVSTAGDANGDGFDDLLIGAPGADVNDQEGAGQSYVVFGREEGFEASFNLAELDGNNGFVLSGINEFDYSGDSVSTAGDVNGDGFDDLLIGAPGAPFRDSRYEADTGVSYVVFGRDFTSRGVGSDTLTGGGSQNTFVIGRDGGTDTITDFGGIGTDVIPTEAEIAEVDTLKFEGAGLSAGNLLLTQQESDLLITFAGVEDTQVVLQGFALENLDNLQQSTGAAVDLGNILFDGQSQIEDSFDVFNADQQRLSVFNLNTVTFLNNLDNTTEGHNGSSDVINAQGGNDNITGLTGNDLLRGGGGNDSLDGGGSAIREVDTLTGGVGTDRFILGSPTAALYDDGDLATVGTSDYALITDFNSSEDVIQLHGQRSDYRLSAAFSSLPAGTAIFRDKLGEEPDELIGVVQGRSQLSLDNNDFSFTPPSELNLAELDGSNGFVINGIGYADRSGDSVSNAGDVNGDGFDDLLIGAPGADPNVQNFSGESYVVFGSGKGFEASFNLAELDGSNGFAIQGIDQYDFSGDSVSTAGDVNGDGFDDLIVGADRADPNGQDSAGQSYVVFGSREGFDASLDLAQLDGSNGFVLNGIDEGDNLGRSVSTAGDFNGDGFDDLLIGAPGAYPNGQLDAGESYVVFGSGKGFEASFNLAELDGSNGFVLSGINEFDYSGSSVSTAGDVNGDGFDDLLIGAPQADPAGESYVVFGSGESFAASFNLAELEGSNGFVINGIRYADFSGRPVSAAGDINGDGFDDLLIGAPLADPDGQYSVGESYVVFGSTEGFEASFNLAELDGSNGFVINGLDEGDRSGESVSTAGDVNGDGFDDLLIGAYSADPNGQEAAGESYVVFGKQGGFAASFNLAELDGSNGFVLNGLDQYDFSGRSVSTAGDVNGDGFDDLLIGAPQDSYDFGGAGKSYVVFGRDFTGQGNLPSTGDAGLNNTASNDILNSGQLSLAAGLADGTSITF